MIGQIQKEEINGKEYDIKKHGVSVAMEVKSIFMSMVMNSGINESSNLSLNQLGAAMMSGIDEKSIGRIKNICLKCVVAPKLDSDSFEELDAETVESLFLAIFKLYTGEADKKKESSIESEA